MKRFLGWTIQVVAIIGLVTWVLYFYGTPYEGVRYLTGWGFWTSYLVAAVLLFIPVLGWLALLLLSFVSLLNVWDLSMLQSLGLERQSEPPWRRRFAAAFALVVTLGNESLRPGQKVAVAQE